MEQTCKLLIIDDEEYVIEGLRKHIDWEAIGIKVIGWAYDGLEGIRKITECKPDIVLVDVRMPILDGISMIEQVYTQTYSPYFIILSGFDDFEFARKAIRFGVVDYILKPSLPKEISQVLERTVGKCRRLKRISREQEWQKEQFKEFLPMVKNTFIMELLQGRITSRKQFEKKCNYLSINISDSTLCVATIVIDEASTIFEQYSEEQEQYILYSIADYSAKMFHIKDTYSIFTDYFAYFIIPVSPDNNKIESLKRQAHSIIEYCNHTYQVSATIGLSTLVKGFSRIPIAYEQSMESVKFSMERNVCLCSLDAPIDTSINSSIPQFYNKEIIVQAIKVGNKEAVNESLRSLFNSIDESSHRNMQYVLPLLFELIGSTASVLAEMGIHYRFRQLFSIVSENLTLSEMESRLVEYYDQVMGKVENVMLIENPKLVKNILELVRRHYSEGITLNEISKSLNFTPNYLSAVFSRSMGQSFSSYITHYRIQQAKKLLKSSLYRINEISSMVGYTDPVYFSKVFKDIVGVTPSQYMK